MAQLPDLSQLRVEDTGAKLFAYLVEQRASKGDCTRHIDLDEPLVEPGQRPREPGPFTRPEMVESIRENVRRYDAKKAKFDADREGRGEPSVNCAIDGYLMFKAVPNAADVSTLAPDYLEKPLQLALSDGTPLELPTLNDPIKRTPGNANDEARAREFERVNPMWAKGMFTEACKYGVDRKKSIISWKDYGVELSGATDWYYLYHRERDEATGQTEMAGHLFVQLFDSQEMKMGKHMPTEGVFAERYLYIGLVCGAGLGKKFMEIAEEASRKLGCKGIALATMANSAGFYYSQGFQFMNKDTGRAIDVSRYTKVDGNKTRLMVDDDPDEPHGRVRGRDDADAAASEQTGRRVSQRRGVRLSYFG